MKTRTRKKPSVASAATLWIERATHRRLAEYALPRGLKLRFAADKAINKFLDAEKMEEKV